MITVVYHVIAGARGVGVGEHTAAEVDGRQVVVDRTEMGELDVRLGDALTAARQVRQTIISHCCHSKASHK